MSPTRRAPQVRAGLTSCALSLVVSALVLLLVLAQDSISSRVIVSSLGLVSLTATVAVTVIIGRLCEGRRAVLLATASALTHVFIAGLCLNFLSQAATPAGVVVRELARASIALAVVGPWLWVRRGSRSDGWLVVGSAPAIVAVLVLLLQGEDAGVISTRPDYSVVLQLGAVLSLLNQLPVIVDQLIAAGVIGWLVSRPQIMQVTGRRATWRVLYVVTAITAGAGVVVLARTSGFDGFAVVLLTAGLVGLVMASALLVCGLGFSPDQDIRSLLASGRVPETIAQVRSAGVAALAAPAATACTATIVYVLVRQGQQAMSALWLATAFIAALSAWKRRAWRAVSLAALTTSLALAGASWANPYPAVDGPRIAERVADVVLALRFTLWEKPWIALFLPIVVAAVHAYRMRPYGSVPAVAMMLWFAFQLPAFVAIAVADGSQRLEGLSLDPVFGWFPLIVAALVAAPLLRLTPHSSGAAGLPLMAALILSAGLCTRAFDFDTPALVLGWGLIVGAYYTTTHVSASSVSSESIIATSVIALSAPIVALTHVLSTDQSILMAPLGGESAVPSIDAALTTFPTVFMCFGIWAVLMNIYARGGDRVVP